MSLTESLQQVKNFEFGELDYEGIGVWPLPIRLFLFALAFALVLSGVYYFHIKELDTELDLVKGKEIQLKKKFEEKAFQAANLESYREQMVEVEKLFDTMLAQLPSDTEVPGLLEDITEIGSGSSLDITTISLQPEKAAEFYVELPIKIVAMGDYHDVSAFASGVASLPRIVTLHNYSLTSDGKGGMQRLEIEAKTYRYKTQDD
jgi:type IV pilus assembly protein PilO